MVDQMNQLTAWICSSNQELFIRKNFESTHFAIKVNHYRAHRIAFIIINNNPVHVQKVNLIINYIKVTDVHILPGTSSNTINLADEGSIFIETKNPACLFIKDKIIPFEGFDLVNGSNQAGVRCLQPYDISLCDIIIQLQRGLLL